MKKNIKILGLLFIVPFLFGYTIYTDNSSTKEYLFIGEVKIIDQKVQYRLVNLADSHKIEWVNEEQFWQSDQLIPGEYLEKLFDLKFVFAAQNENWSIIISEKTLKISIKDEDKLIEKEIPIKINIEESPIDNVFLPRFESLDHKAFGVIRGIWLDPPCEINITDKNTIFELFLNYDGNLFKGCASLEKIKPINTRN